MNLKDKVSIGLKILSSRLLGRSMPLFVQFALTNRCNKKCAYCDYSLRKQEELSTREIKTIFDGLSALGCARLNLIGGEPLLREDIGEIIDYGVSRKMQCVMTTNGSLVPEKIGLLGKLAKVVVSMDGIREINDRTRGTGSYDQAIKAIEILQRARIDVQISCVLTKHNLDSIDELLLEAKRLKCMVSINIPFHSPENGKSAFAQLADDEAYKHALRSIIAAKKRGLPVLFSIPAYEYALRWPSYSVDMAGKNEAVKMPSCHAGIYFGYIDTNGDFYPCNLYNGSKEFTPLNCIRDGVKKAWDNCKAHRCQACFVPCYLEYNLFFSLNPRTIANVRSDLLKY